MKKKVIINLVVGLVMAVVVFFLNWETDRTLFHRLCDSCFVAGVMLMGVGGLKWARNAGTFDMMAYGISAALDMALPWLKREQKDVDFAAYKERKQEERKPAGDLLIAGAVYLALAVIFLILYQLTT